MPPDITSLRRSFKGSARFQTDFLAAFQNALAVTNSYSAANRGSKLSKAITLAGTVVSLITLSKSVHTFYVNYTEADSYFVKIREDDRLYRVAEAWLMEVMPEEDKISLYTRTLILHDDSVSDDGEMPAPDGGTAPTKTVRVATSFDGSVKQEISLGKHKIRLEASIPESKSQGGPQDIRSMGVREFRFMCSTLEGRDAVLEELRNRAKNLINIDPQFFVSRSWGNFSRKVTPKRDTESVILKENQMEEITKHIRTFLNNEKAYASSGIPYHTGLMFHGVPGTGKSSTATAIASEFGLDVYYVSLPVLDGDEALQDCFSNIPPRSMVVLEDIDVVHATRSREDSEEKDKKGVTMAGLLNVLDGQLAPHGVVVIMTTNHLEVLDEAIIRPGRIDLISELGALDDFQLRKICNYYMGFEPEGLPFVSEEDGITSADVVGIFREYITDFSKAADKLVMTIGDKLTQVRKGSNARVPA